MAFLSCIQLLSWEELPRGLGVSMGQPGQWGLHFEAGRVSSSSSGDRCRARAWEGWRQEDWIPILLLAQLLLLTLILSLPPFFFFFFFPSFLPKYLSRTQHAPGMVPDPGERVPVPLSSPGEGSKSFIPNNHTQTCGGLQGCLEDMVGRTGRSEEVSQGGGTLLLKSEGTGEGKVFQAKGKSESV